MEAPELFAPGADVILCRVTSDRQQTGAEPTRKRGRHHPEPAAGLDVGIARGQGSFTRQGSSIFQKAMPPACCPTSTSPTREKSERSNTSTLPGSAPTPSELTKA